MNWNGQILKGNARAILNRFYWKNVLVALVITIAASGQIPISNPLRIINRFSSISPNYYNDYNEFEEIFDGFASYMSFEEQSYKATNMASRDLSWLGMIIGIVIFIMLIVYVVQMLIRYLILMPLDIGCRRYFLGACYYNADLGNVGSGFRNGTWKRNCGIMFLREMYIFLWTLLFIVPGIIKAYEYMMVPYLVVDHPDWTNQAIFDKSRELMMGSKWNAFVLGLSFIGWRLLSILTFGLLDVFYTNPYYYLTETQLYLCLRNANDYYYNQANMNFNNENNNL